MRKQTAWAHLPNAHHIDRILNDVKRRPRVWENARVRLWAAGSGTTWSEALAEARYASQGAGRDAARYAALGAVLSMGWEAIRGAISALIAWDDAGDILDMPPDAVRLLAASGHHPAVLLLPAAIALATTL